MNGENIDEKDASDNIVIENLMETQSVFRLSQVIMILKRKH